jgi:hypothetical protein
MGPFAKILLAACLAGLAIGQAPSAPDIPVVTVCEVLNDLARYKDKSIIVVGVVANTDEGGWLIADCEKRLVTDGYAWQDSISLTYVRGQQDPPPELPEHFKWNNKLVAAKLKEIQRTTKLRPRPENDRWRAIFGRLETRVPPQTYRDPRGNLEGYGFGHLSSSPAQLISPQDRHAWRSLH